MLNESLHKENLAKDREIRKLHKDAQQYEQTILNLRNEISATKHQTEDISRKDAEVMAGMCCTGAECGDWEPVKDFNSIIREEIMDYQERMQKMEASLKSSTSDVRTLRKMNVGLREELQSLRSVCAGLSEQCRAAHLRGQFKDDIIREMRRQLKQAKAKDSFRSCDIQTSTPKTQKRNESSPNSSFIKDSVRSPSLSHESAEESTVQCDCLIHPARPLPKRVQTQSPPTSKAKTETSKKVEQLYLNDNAGRSSASGLGHPCVIEPNPLNGSQSATDMKQSSEPTLKCTIRKSGSCNLFPAKESVGRSSAVASPSSSCASARAHYYQNKLLATLQILQNKEETVRVQADSLAVAEARIAALTARGTELRREIERKGKELQALRLSLEETRLQKTDVSITADIEEMEDQKSIVTTLQNNLSVIEELYRECFYETAKQEDLLEMLRKSYLDVRLMDKKKSDQISKLHSVINTQKWSLDRCQDIATEVDNLKVEISNFLNSSSNDSGMWEESIAGSLNEDLQDIATQLLRLRDLLTGDCTCGLEEENNRLKQANEESVVKEIALNQKISELETDLENKMELDRRYQNKLEVKEQELKSIRQRLLSMEEATKEQNANCDTLSRQLSQTRALLTDKSAELAKVQTECEMYKETLARMSRQLDKFEEITKENISLRNQNAEAIREVSRLQRQTQTLEDEIKHVRGHCQHIDSELREKASSVRELESALDKAHEQGAALCEEARRVVAAVSIWARDMRGKHRELAEKMKEKDAELLQLQYQLQEQRRPSEYSLPTDTTRVEERRRHDPTSASETHTCPCVGGNDRGRRGTAASTSTSEMASCSSTPAPIPPRRTLKKSSSRTSCEDRINLRGGWWVPERCDASVQRPTRRDASTCDCDVTTARGAGRRDTSTHCARCDATHTRTRRDRITRTISPGEQMFSRLESMSAALADSYRRWTRNRRTDCRT